MPDPEAVFRGPCGRRHHEVVAYDLVFWKQERSFQAEPHAIRDALASNEPVDGLLEIPVDEWMAAVVAAFPGATREPNGPNSELVCWISGDGKSSFQIEWSPIHVWITLRGVSTQDGNRLVDLAAGFGCPLYDPQTDERFDSWTDH